MKRERDLDRAVRRALAKLPDVLVFPNESGKFRTLDGKRVVTCGLGKGSADLVGILGPRGRWFCLELKADRGELRPEQALWLNIMHERGALCAVVRCVEDALELIERGRREQ